MLFDTHTHINDKQFATDREEVIRRAREEYGVSYMLNVGYNRRSIQTSLQLAEKYDFIYTSVGWHPHDASTFTPEELKWLKSLTSHPKVVALGEMGLDYYRDLSPRDKQAEAFRQQIRLAREVNLPIIIHDRDAHEDVVRILQEEKAEEVGGVLHCFAGDLAMMQQCLEMNFMIGIGGPVTFKSATALKEIATCVPDDRLIVETDCPYLAPHPHRGKRNEPGYVRLVAETIAELRGLTLEQLAHLTMQNGKRLFRLEHLA